MMRWIATVAFAALSAGWSAQAWAQDDEDSPPAEVEIEDITGATDAEPVVYQVTLPRVWMIVTPSFLLDAFFDLHGSHWSEGTVNFAYGGEFIIRRLKDDGSEDFDLVFSIDWADLSMTDDWWLEADDPIRDTDWGRNSLSLLTFDVAINWVTEITQIWDLYYGVGLGIGVVLGEFTKQDIDPRCIVPAGESREVTIVTANCADAQTEPGSSPEVEDGVPPVIPALSLTLGTRWTIEDNWIIQLEGGWKSLYFYGGLELGYAWGR